MQVSRSAILLLLDTCHEGRTRMDFSADLAAELDRLKALIARYDAWEEQRAMCSAGEETGGYVSAVTWQDSDDTAVELLRDIVTWMRTPVIVA